QGVLMLTGKASLQPSLAGRLQLSADNLVLTELWPDWPGGLHVNAELTAAFTKKDFDIIGLALKIPETETALLFAGKGSLAEPADADAEKPRFHGALTWENVQWPLFSAADEKSVAKSAKGRIDLEGAPEAYRLALDADISGRDIPAGNWRAAGQGDSGGFKLSGLDADILQGALHLRGELDWSPVWRWDLALAGKDINPGAHWREWPGKLSLDIRSQGGSQEGVLTAQADIQEVKGKLRGYPLKFHAQADMQGPRYQVKNLEFRSGSARLTADGSFAEKLAFDWAVRAPNLAALLPGVQGGIDAKGSIKGPPALPEVELRINAKSLAFDNNRLAALRADAAFDLGKSQKFRLNLLATDYRQDKKRVLKSLRLQGRGRMTAHTLTAELKTAKEQLSLLLKGGLAQARWQGALETLTANSPDFGKWKLSSPAALDLSSTKIRLDRACLRAVSKKGGQLCAELKREADTSVRASLKNVPLSLAKPFMPPDSKITGSLEGDLAATMRSNGALRSDVALTLSPGVLKVGADRPEFKLRGGNLQLKINRDGLSGNLLLRLLKQSEIRGKLELPRFNRFPAHAAQSLAGTIEVDFADFGVLPPIPHLTDLKGVADLSVDVNGSLADPRIQGLLRIRNTSANLPDFGLQLKDFNLALNTEGTMKGRNTIRLKAGLRSEEGRMEIKGDGKLELPAFTNWQARLNVRGKNLEAIDTADIRALISPDIRVRLVPGNVDVQGTLKIPEAMITPSISIGGEASATGISDDVVIVNAVTSAAEQRETSPLALTSKLKVILGDEVSLNIVDFHSHLGGSLLLIRKPGQDVFLGDGELQILNGVFKAYGQDLEIKRGRVIFADSPLDNPGLNIKAIREIRNDTGNPKVDKAGVHIQGTAQSPRITLFSEPMVAKKQILSYIVSGSALGDSQTDRSLSVGRYLSPRLYVSFGYRLLDKTKTFNIRYDMSKKWGVESTVGEEDSGVDFSYTLER
ncbi:MAG: hypothetical protein GY862_32565, partial [Gammaproteobacteria bacterium]|nr:hypothetical protein [Gammaproteobacteria bacterium]